MGQRLEYEVVVKQALRARSSLLALLSGQRRIGKALNVEMAVVETRIADLFFEVGRKGLFHLDVQSYNFRFMPHRMCVYGVLGLWQFDKATLDSVVLYIGKAKLQMPSSFDARSMRGTSRVIDIREIDADLLLSSRYPGDHVLALLAGGGVERLKEIVAKVARMKGVRRQEAVGGLSVLAGLRDIAERMKMELKEAGLLVNIEENVILRDVRDFGAAEGRKAGRDEGRKEGRKEGRDEGRKQLLREMLEGKFGRLPKWAAARLDKATPQQVQRWSIGLLQHRTLEGVIGAR